MYDPSWNDELKALYRHDIQEIWDPTINRHVWNQYHNQLEIYLDIVDSVAGGNPIRILDVGCAQGTLALLLSERGHDVTAIDLRQSYLDYAKSRYTHGKIRFVNGNALELDFEEQFHLIYANQIIEHVVYPLQLVSRLSAMLRPAGRLVVTTPNWHYVMNRLPSFEELGDPRQYEHLQFTSDADGHFFAYRASELLRIFLTLGLGQVETRFFETPFVSGHLKVRYVHNILPAPLLQFCDRLALAVPMARLLAHQLLVTGCR